MNELEQAFIDAYGHIPINFVEIDNDVVHFENKMLGITVRGNIYYDHDFQAVETVGSIVDNIDETIELTQRPTFWMKLFKFFRIV